MRERERKREERGREKDREVKPNKLPVAIVFLLVRSFGLTWGHSSSLFLTHTHTHTLKHNAHRRFSPFASPMPLLNLSSHSYRRDL